MQALLMGISAERLDENGQPLADGAPPPPRDDTRTWAPFSGRRQFRFVEVLYEQGQVSAGLINNLLELWAADKVAGQEAGDTFFKDANDVHAHIDAIREGQCPWYTYAFKYDGPIDAQSKAWKHDIWLLHTRHALDVAALIAGNTDFDTKWDYVPYEEFTSPDNRRFCNSFSGRKAWRDAVGFLSDDAYIHYPECVGSQDRIIREHPEVRGAMLFQTVQGADKTTVSVATGHTEYHPFYFSAGNLHNDMRRAHRESVVPMAFLSIPKGMSANMQLTPADLPLAARDADDDEEFRTFRKQLYHAQITKVLEPLRRYMTEPVLMRCPDGYYRRVVFELGPFIADYPEQVYMAGIVQGWCPKYIHFHHFCSVRFTYGTKDASHHPTISTKPATLAPASTATSCTTLTTTTPFGTPSG
jgi:hypothetical protein